MLSHQAFCPACCASRGKIQVLKAREALDVVGRALKANTPAEHLTIGTKQVRQGVASMFLIADEGENGGASWWCVYMCGLKVFGSPDEDAADAFRHKLHAYTLRSLGLTP